MCQKKQKHKKKTYNSYNNSNCDRSTPPAMDSNFHECVGGGGAKYSTETFPEHFG